MRRRLPSNAVILKMIVFIIIFDLIYVNWYDGNISNDNYDNRNLRITKTAITKYINLLKALL